ncbi:hypothetical protein L1987_74482 [Smallanthus sonchifolius]|uniref:Uncharacterized protein n=1 Tax=Smallanthus sonchifolius TaxID=185202 RepID=A0ACB9A3G7_9ASTR|nr:hypothetical protein L1987_74482 [Smallanthus sonchifolius]
MEIEPSSCSRIGDTTEDDNNGVCLGGSTSMRERATYLVWRDLMVVLPNFGQGHTKRLLHRISGFAEPGRIMAIMGPSGSGKSTLLDSLAGRLSKNVVMTGDILLNGEKKKLSNGVVAYVTQEDVLMGTLTVRETITYSAYLRLPTTFTNEEVKGIIEGTIMEMGLVDCGDSLIGTWHLRGISGGEKKRLSIALEILIRPRGEKVYFGEAKDAITEEPKGSDAYKKFSVSEIKATLAEKYKRSNFAKKAESKMKQISQFVCFHGPETSTIKMSQAGWLKQLSTLTQRSFVNMSRDIGYYWLRVIIYSIVSICVGTIFYDVGTGYTAILARGACGGFITGFMVFMSIGSFPSFIEDTKIFTRERLNGYYGVVVFILSNFLSSLPFMLMISFVTGTITWNMVKFRHGFSRYAYYCLNLFASIAVVESCMMVVASLVPNFLMGIVTGAGIIGIMMMTSGFFRQLPDLPKPFWRYPVSYINYGSRSLQGTYKNDMLGLVFNGLAPGDPKLTGEEVITKMYPLPLNHSKWWDFVCNIRHSGCVSHHILHGSQVQRESFPVFPNNICKKNALSSKQTAIIQTIHVF